MDDNRWYCVVLELVPGFALYRGVYELSAYAQLASATQQGTGLAFSNLGDEGNGMVAAWVILLAEWPVFMLAALYLEQVSAYWARGGGGPNRPPMAWWT